MYIFLLKKWFVCVCSVVKVVMGGVGATGIVYESDVCGFIVVVVLINVATPIPQNTLNCP